MNLLFVVGARPNFMKVAPIMKQVKSSTNWHQVLVHTGQHYDVKMSDVFFQELGLPEPDEHLHVGGGTHAEQTAKVMLAFEPVLQKYQPDWLVVVGDVNSTLATSLVASKMGVKIAHVEAGLRSGDRTMPEEINRILTDAISDLLLIPSEDGRTNLLHEGIPDEKIVMVGNVMIDSLVQLLPLAIKQPVLQQLQIQPKHYYLATLHRPSNVDVPEVLQDLLQGLEQLPGTDPVIFPVHPRTRKRIVALNRPVNPRIQFVDPLGYLDFLCLINSAKVIITDSGGIQEESSFLGIPCLTTRKNTERPVTVTMGTNRLIEPTSEAIISVCKQVLSTGGNRVPAIPFWDGHTAERIVHALSK